jgi:hypothetical protein
MSPPTTLAPTSPASAILTSMTSSADGVLLPGRSVR